MDELNKLRARIIELEVANREGVKLIDWFEVWLNNRDEPFRYDPIGLGKDPPVYNVNYSKKHVETIRNFMKAVLVDVSERD